MFFQFSECNSTHRASSPRIVHDQTFCLRGPQFERDTASHCGLPRRKDLDHNNNNDYCQEKIMFCFSGAYKMDCLHLKSLKQ